MNLVLKVEGEIEGEILSFETKIYHYERLDAESRADKMAFAFEYLADKVGRYAQRLKDQSEIEPG